MNKLKNEGVPIELIAPNEIPNKSAISADASRHFSGDAKFCWFGANARKR